MLKEHLIFISVSIASALFFSPIVDKHPVASPDNEPIEPLPPLRRRVGA